MANFYTYLKDLEAWVQNPSIPMYGRWNHPPPSWNPNAPGEGGVDLTAPPGTPVYALGTGPLLSAASFASQGLSHPGSVLSQRVNVPGVGPQDIYYQHIDLLPGFQTCVGGNCGGRIIQAGQQIGFVGSVGETELGFNPNWGSLYGPANHPGPWPSDPRSWLVALATGAPAAGSVPPSPNQGGSNTGTSTTSSNVCDVWIIGGLICSQWFEQAVIVLVGILLALVALVIFAAPEAKKIVENKVPI